MAGEITISQLFQTPTLLGVFAEIKPPISLFQRFLNMQPGGGGYRTLSGRNIGWDYFNPSRGLAQGRAPMSGPARVNRQALGHGSAQAFRMHESLFIPQEEVFRTRPLGSQIGTVDPRGQSFVRRQINFLSQRFSNSREFMISRMLRGGFGVKIEGETWIPVEKGDADEVFSVDSNIPATHLSQLDMDTGSNIIDASWDDPGTDVISQILSIDKAAERVYGEPYRHIWINGTVFDYLLKNIGMQNVGGQVFRTFESLTERNLPDIENRARRTGYDVVFRALPLHTFHIYNGVLNVGSGNELSITDAITTANSSLTIPDTNAIFMGDPGEWAGWVAGSEVVAENILDAGQERFGFHPWTTRTIDPPGWDLKAVDNGLPALIIPRSVAYGTVVF